MIELLEHHAATWAGGRLLDELLTAIERAGTARFVQEREARIGWRGATGVTGREACNKPCNNPAKYSLRQPDVKPQKTCKSAPTKNQSRLS